MPRTLPSLEVQERLLALMADDALLNRLLQAARFHVRHLRLHGVESDELVNEAFVRHLDGRRRWEDDADPAAVLLGTVQSVAWEWRVKANRFVPESALAPAGAEEDTGEEGILARQAAPDPGPDATASVAGIYREVEAAVSDDEHVLSIVLGRSEGLTPTDIQKEFGMTPTQYASALKKLRRAINDGKLDEVRHG